MEKARYELFRYPASRLGTLDVGQFALRKHHIAALLEIDVTEAVAAVRRRRAGGDGVSFFSWMVKAISTAIAENPYIHALQAGRRRTAVFEEIDISVLVEKAVSGKRVPLPLLIRKTNEKSVEAIHAEIKAARGHEVRGEADYVLAEDSPSGLAMRLYYALPQALRLFLLRRLLRNPRHSKAMMGTAVITSVGTAGHLAGWILPKAMHNLCFALGSIVKKPWVVSNRVEIRDILHLTVLFDHDVVDGVPAARFLARLARRIQRGV
jgi:pyruvate/2-oxoglutarate dehydrogenase complex dihydrolipoamide acyltransferase (E2) component